MKYYSLNRKAADTDFPHAVREGLAPDRGLYFPEQVPHRSDLFGKDWHKTNFHELCYQAIKPFVGGSIPDQMLEQIVEETLNFEFPLVPVGKDCYALELFHGPTLAFKDVGARFMARCLGYFQQQSTDSRKLTVLVATSGDTGGAVANGFYQVPGIEVVILYPKGKVSEIQEKQLTTLGANITALEVDGVFDDCQDMVKTAFLDDQLLEHCPLTSANSINVARWLPQMFYYIAATQQLISQTDQKLVFSVPSGNFGNICAGMIAVKMGLPIHHFVASTNVNDTVPRFLLEGIYEPHTTIPTISNAMDVSSPSNFIRIQEIYDNDLLKIQEHLSGYRYTDEETRLAMQSLFKNHQYIADPHGAIGWLGLDAYQQKSESSTVGVFLETAHPAKFLDVVEQSLNQEVVIPSELKGLLSKEKQAHSIQGYEDLKSFLLDRS